MENPRLVGLIGIKLAFLCLSKLIIMSNRLALFCCFRSSHSCSKDTKNSALMVIFCQQNRYLHFIFCYSIMEI